MFLGFMKLSLITTKFDAPAKTVPNRCSTMAHPSVQKLRLYLHLVPVFGAVLSLWTLYGEPVGDATDLSNHQQSAALREVSRLSVLMGVSVVSAIALLGAGASMHISHLASLRFLVASTMVGSGYFLVSLGLMFRVATGASVKLPGISQLSRRLP